MDGDRPKVAVRLGEPLLRVRGLCHAYDAQPILRDVEFELRTGEVLALMGVNGAGKSTLMSVLSGDLSPTAGGLLWQGDPLALSSPHDAHRIGIAMVQQELQLVPGLTIAENIFLGREPVNALGVVDRAAMNRATRSLLDRLSCHCDPDMKVGDLRVAAQQLVEIAKALSREARVLIFDEPTAALSEREAQDLLGLIEELRSGGTAILYTTHRMDEVFAIASRILVLRDGAVVSDRPIGEVSREGLIHDMTGNAVPEEAAQRAPRGVHAPRLSVRGLGRTHPGGAPALQDIDFDLAPGEVLGIGGLMGAGRSELLEILAGDAGAAWSGDIRLDGAGFKPASPLDAIRHGIAFVTEDRKGSGLILDQSVEDNIALASLSSLSRYGLLRSTARRSLAAASVDRLRIKVQGFTQPARRLSGGNQQKVVLAKWLATGPRVLLLDEPTRGIDIAAKASFYALLEELIANGVSILLVSSDWAELIALSDRILVLQGGRVAALLDRRDCTQARLLAHATPGGPVLQVAA